MTPKFEPRQDFFIGIDSDGCAFDTMEVKHKECFIPNIIRYFDLAAVSKYARECAEFVNLYSKWRGINRFPGLVMTVDLLSARPEIIRRNMALPNLSATRRWLETETKLGNPALAELVQRAPDPEMELLLAWSKAVNESVELVVKKVPPFPLVRESLQKLCGQADLFVCSATPNEALTREWQEHGLASLVAEICGQEVGSKKEILAISAKYPEQQSLMIGDAPGDLAAARANNTLFFPVIPGREEESWQRFYEEGLERFLSKNYAGDYEHRLIAEFEASLPGTPPWGTS